MRGNEIGGRGDGGVFESSNRYQLSILSACVRRWVFDAAAPSRKSLARVLVFVQRTLFVRKELYLSVNCRSRSPNQCVLAGNEREKSKKGPLALAFEWRAA